MFGVLFGVLYCLRFDFIGLVGSVECLLVLFEIGLDRAVGV